MVTIAASLLAFVVMNINLPSGTVEWIRSTPLNRISFCSERKQFSVHAFCIDVVDDNDGYFLKEVVIHDDLVTVTYRRLILNSSIRNEMNSFFRGRSVVNGRDTGENSFENGRIIWVTYGNSTHV